MHLGSMYLSIVSCIREVCSSLYRALSQTPFTNIYCVLEKYLVHLGSLVLFSCI